MSSSRCVVSILFFLFVVSSVFPLPLLPSSSSTTEVNEGNQESSSTPSNPVIIPVTSLTFSIPELYPRLVRETDKDGKEDDDDDKDDNGGNKNDDGDKGKDTKDETKEEAGEDKKEEKTDKDGGKDEDGDGVDSKSDVTQPDEESDQTSEENEGANSDSDPNTEEEGDSSSESRTSEEKRGHEDETKEVKESESNTTENDKDESDVSSSSSSESTEDKNKLLIIMLDGVRPDFITRDVKRLKAFAKMTEKGVRAKYVKPVFPSNAVPNWWSIATGKYPERTHIVNDIMFDGRTRHVFDLNAPDEIKEKHWWRHAEPIWVSAKKQKKRVHVSWWLGCEAVPPSPNFVCDGYKDLADDDKYDDVVAAKLKEMISKFKQDTLDLGMVYYEAVGEAGRKTGPDSRKAKKALRDFDKVLAEVFTQLEEKKLDESVNVIVLSDNGLVVANKEIQLEKYLDMNDVDHIVGTGAFVMIRPEKKKLDSVYSQLRNGNIRGLNVYKKDKLPPRYRLKKSEQVLPIILTADEGYAIIPPKIKEKVFPEEEDDDAGVGVAGYDPDHVEEMRAIMYAIGPDFRNGYEVETVKQVDHYNLFCRLLDIKCKDNDGEMKKIFKLLKETETEEEEDSPEDSDEDGGTMIGTTPTTFLVMLIVSIRLLLFSNKDC